MVTKIAIAGTPCVLQWMFAFLRNQQARIGTRVQKFILNHMGDGMMDKTCLTKYEHDLSVKLGLRNNPRSFTIWWKNARMTFVQRRKSFKYDFTFWAGQLNDEAFMFHRISSSTIRSEGLMDLLDFAVFVRIRTLNGLIEFRILSKQDVWEIEKKNKNCLLDLFYV